MDESLKPGAKNSQAEKFSSPEYQRLRTKLNELLTELLNKDPEKLDEMQAEIFLRAAYLRKKYLGEPIKAQQYLMFHVFSGPGINPAIVIVGDDFPGDDSMKKFVDGLADKYKIKE